MNRKQNVASKTLLAAALALAILVPLSAQAANKLIVKDAAGTNDKTVLTDGGQIGLGTNAPVGAVHISGNSYSTTQLIESWNGTSANGGGGFLGFHNNAANALPNAGDRIGYFLFGSFVTPARPAPVGDRVIGGGMRVVAEAAWSVNADGSGGSAPAYIVFQTTPVNGIGAQERLRITSAGNIGIGMTSPSQKLDVAGAIRLNSGAQPACTVSLRGTLWYSQGTTGVADTLAVCGKDAAENYAWRPLF